MALTSDECRRLLSVYNSALTSRVDGHRSKNAAKDLLELDSWRLEELSKNVRERSPSYMNKEELEKLMDCKLSRGKFRPRLKALISSNNPADVKSATQKAFSEFASGIPAILAAVKTLSELKGVGPATATMVLQAYSDDVPFMSDEAMLQVFGGDKTKLKYDVKTCRAFLEKVHDIVKSIKGMGCLNVNDEEFSAAEVERALFTKQLTDSDKPEKRPSSSISPPPTKAGKRKSEAETEGSTEEKTSQGDKPTRKSRKVDTTAKTTTADGSKRRSLRGK